MPSNPPPPSERLPLPPNERQEIEEELERQGTPKSTFGCYFGGLVVFFVGPPLLFAPVQFKLSIAGSMFMIAVLMACRTLWSDHRSTRAKTRKLQDLLDHGYATETTLSPVQFAKIRVQGSDDIFWLLDLGSDQSMYFDSRGKRSPRTLLRYRCIYDQQHNLYKDAMEATGDKISLVETITVPSTTSFDCLVPVNRSFGDALTTLRDEGI